MNHATTTRTTKSRRAHPAVVRAALRSCIRLDGRLVKQTDGNHNVTQFIYGDQATGLNRLLVKIVYPTLSQDLQYDQRNRITKSTDTAAGSAIALDGAPSQTTTNQYDAAGNLTVVTDPANRSTGTQYNAHGEVTQTTDPDNGITQYGYDTRGNLISVTDAKGNTHRFEYDRLDRMVKEIRPLGQTISYAYDAVGNLTQVTDPKGQIKQYAYDDANRRTQEDHYLNAAALTAQNAVKSITYTYNTLDRLTGYNDGSTIATYTYDPRQLRQIGESINHASTSSAPTGFTLSTSTTYNALGQKSSLTYPDGATYNYTYDTNNQFSTVNLPTGYGSITFNSYLWTVPTQITLPGGSVRSQSYDGLLRIKDLNVKDPGQSQVLNYQYGYDLTNNITSKVTEAGTTNYGYDTLDRLVTASYTAQTGTQQADEAYTYDPIANRLTDSKTAAAIWLYNENNQLTQADNLSYTYDDNGNTINQTDANNAANTRNYVYDTDNRLIEVRDAGNNLIAAYSYDPFGRRLSKDVGSVKTYYFYNAEGLIAEADATGQVTKSYGYAPGSTFTTNPLWMKTGTAYYTYQNDHLGTPMKLLNQSGVVVWSATYDAFGRATIDPASTVTNNLRFPGQYEDAETGLHYNWMRYYDPATGRYVTSDPIGLEGGVNEYGYVGGNSLVRIDPSGLKDICEIRKEDDWREIGRGWKTVSYKFSDGNNVVMDTIATAISTAKPAGFYFSMKIPVKHDLALMQLFKIVYLECFDKCTGELTFRTKIREEETKTYREDWMNPGSVQEGKPELLLIEPELNMQTRWGGTVQMNIVMAFFCVLALTPALCAGAEIRDIGIGDNGFQFADPAMQRKFTNALKRDGVVFQQREDGMVVYSSENEEKVSRVQKEILETTFTPSTHFEDERVQNQFIKQLKTEGIRFSIEVKGGKNWVTWSEQDDSAVKKISDEVLENAISDIIKNRELMN